MRQPPSHIRLTPAQFVCLAVAIPAVLLGNSTAALFLGIGFTLISRGADLGALPKLSGWALQAGVILLGLKLPLDTVVAISTEYGPTLVSAVILALALGALLGRFLRVEREASILVATGTAICGGTAVASMAPVIRASSTTTAQVLILIFILNGVALLLFPLVAQWLGMSAEQFGLWCALAIHDTSSVVGAASHGGPESLAVATTVKLARTLALVPVLLIAGFIHHREGRTRIPLFVLAFLVASLTGSLITFPEPFISGISSLSKGLFCLALFLIGTGMKPQLLRAIDRKLLIQSTSLWAILVVGSLLWVL